MKSFVAGSALAVALVLVAVFAPLLAVHDPYLIPFGGARIGPSTEHWFGTDQLGRDVFARVLYGARTSLVVGVCSAALAGVTGLAVGVLAGWRRGWIDVLLMRLGEVFLVLPAILVAAALVLAIGRTTLSIVAVLAIVGWPVIARIARAEVVRLRSAGFIDAARIGGATEWRIVRRHVVPHVLPVVVALGVTAVATSILAEAALSFLGIGITEPTASWGLMIAQGRRFIVSSPYLILFPAAAVFVTVLAFVLMGNGLRTVLKLDRQ